MRINLTQHDASPEQGCAPRSEEQAREIRELLTFVDIPTLAELAKRARALASIAEQSGATQTMIGGAPYLMPILDPALRDRGIQPLYAFSRRESVERVQADGSTVTTKVFRHLGFVRF